MIVSLIIGATFGAFLMSLVSVTRQRDVEAVVDALERFLLPPADADMHQLWDRVVNAFFRAREG